MLLLWEHKESKGHPKSLKKENGFCNGFDMWLLLLQGYLFCQFGLLIFIMCCGFYFCPDAEMIAVSFWLR